MAMMDHVSQILLSFIHRPLNFYYIIFPFFLLLTNLIGADLTAG